jgi:hypothetical protein
MNTVTETERRKSNETKILELLQAKGEATNSELLKIGGFRYGARLKSLRDDGYKIKTVKEKAGLFRYVYFGHEDDDLQVKLFEDVA